MRARGRKCSSKQTKGNPGLKTTQTLPSCTKRDFCYKNRRHTRGRASSVGRRKAEGILDSTQIKVRRNCLAQRKNRGAMTGSLRGRGVILSLVRIRRKGDRSEKRTVAAPGTQAGKSGGEKTRRQLEHPDQVRAKLKRKGSDGYDGNRGRGDRFIPGQPVHSLHESRGRK